ncbi:MAG: Gfo/Idh/MocA family oxidoreductase [Hyphomicrobiales bacterium]|nr:Gfo/Idh/MocA family oxidoreductase [Hyphomicrobiales bacterium]
MLRVGLAGVGFGAQVYIPALAATPGIRLVALADGGSGRAAQIAEAGTTPYSDAGRMIADAALDMVIVAVPPRAQAPLVHAALDRGLSVLCEKPFGFDLDEAEAMAARARTARGAFALGFQFRYDAGLATLARAVRAGEIGRIHHVDVAWLTSGGARPDRQWSWRDDAARSGGILTEFGSHVLDYLAWLCAAPVEAVVLSERKRIQDRPAGEGRLRTETADSLSMLAHVGEVPALIAISNTESVPLGHRVTVHGEGGRLVWCHRPPFGLADHRIWIEDGAGERVLPLAGAPAHPDMRVAASAALLADWLAAHHGAAPPDLPGFEAGLAVRRAMQRARAHPLR